MRVSSKRRVGLAVVAALILVQPIVLLAFDLIEFPVFVTLDPSATFSRVFAAELPNTGFTIANPDPSRTVELDGTSSLRPIGLLEGEAVQEGFVLLDGTLQVEVSAFDPTGARAAIRTTYRMDVDRAALGRDFLGRALVRQGVVRDLARARARARAMGLPDARIMRFARRDARDPGRWVRAVRRILDGGRADVRFARQMDPDGVLGHYGTATDAGQRSYVWAVLDRNSRYAVGVTVDRDNDGVVNADDNCIGLVNPNQSDFDTDGFGDACDADDDNDGIADGLDNCPLGSNPGQEDFDGDGLGDVCDDDRDGDGVADGADECLETELGSIVDPLGCSIADRCPCESEWKNHGAYVRCVARTSEVFVELGLITEDDKDGIVSAAAQSSCGF